MEDREILINPWTGETHSVADDSMLASIRGNQEEERDYIFSPTADIPLYDLGSADYYLVEIFLATLAGDTI